MQDGLRIIRENLISVEGSFHGDVQTHIGGEGNSSSLFDWDADNNQWVGLGIASGSTI